MKHRHVQWLYGELPGLVAAGVLPEVGAESLRAHYGPVKSISAARLAVVLLSVLGAMLIGSGIILLLAHNWEDLGRPVRAVLSFAPLVAGQMLVAWTLYRKQDSVAWREGSGAFLAMGIGASIALIAQTYHIPGDPEKFLLTWALLGLPILYLLRSSMAAALYFIGVTAWAGEAQQSMGHAIGYWPLMAAAIPAVWMQFRDGPRRPGTAFVGWALCLSLCVGLAIVLEKVLPGLWTVIYAAMLACFFLAGRTWYTDTPAQPFTPVGLTGTVILALVFTFEDIWLRVGFNHYRGGSTRYLELFGIQDYVLAFGLLAAAVILTVRLVKRRDFAVLPWAASPALAVVGFAAASIDGLKAFPPMLFNVYLLALGVLVLRQGILDGRLGGANAGMGILALLFTIRFFDSNMSILARGVAFILIGAAFLGANLWFARRLSAQTTETQS
ncbi:MAG: DUF2157 domain-containing protein [Candidatus Hydrogenedentes bacterium]|nr:DUF2157 domain-containing protein [Candidatus Hydrogenedentota bacterium]